ncbi:MAG: hypothetical protein AVDCRST_MAG49-1859 [uncultured Thermomicrobiales bacterium]|uniref:Uncharacterized protein n=1 Tax=uncultured Thermomicrobiales bacterium TaxID=1645740 RepID=A0A6J4UIS7_9BACT|nr:MAG: hypothetical protein AVDCRST_MAG49-1859 [uncultured Thermomicrobiales bacterium]
MGTVNPLDRPATPDGRLPLLYDRDTKSASARTCRPGGAR